MRILLFGFILLCSTTLYTQSYITKKDAPKQALKLYQEGQKYYLSNQFEKAISCFEKAVSKYPNFIDAELQWASVCFDRKDYHCAETHFRNVLSMDSTYNLKVYYTLALTQYHLDHYKEAHENISHFLNSSYTNQDILIKANALAKNIIFADSAYSHPQDRHLVYLDRLNSEFSEYLPSISADGKMAVFTRRTERGDEDMYISYLMDSIWSEAQPIDELNTPYNEGSPALSPDGTSLVFTICDRKYSYGGCDLYISEFRNGYWNIPVNMGDVINTPAYESNACFADNGHTLYFTSNRKGSLGGYDLWKSQKKPDEKWSVPKNLGNTINTPGDELCPFMHPNNRVLYFSSDYHPGMGGRDLFYSIIDESGNWMKPVNLGYPINSKGDESSFVVFPDGQKAWMASDMRYLDKKFTKIRPNLDLYEMILPPSLRIKPSTFIQITVSDVHTNLPVKASIRIYNLSTNKLFFEKDTREDGKLLIALPVDSDYGLHVYHKDYILEPDQIRTSISNNNAEPYIIHKKLIKLDQNKEASFILKNIFFESGSAVLRPESKFELNAIHRLFEDHPNIRLKITGHTDNMGSDQDNLILSEQRALSVVHFLIQKGLQKERFIYEGKGESQPISDNNTEEGRQENRRIEFRIISQ